MKEKAEDAWNNMVIDRNLKLTPAVRLVVGEEDDHFGEEGNLLTDEDKSTAMTQCRKDVETVVKARIKQKRGIQVQSAANDAWDQMVKNGAHLTQAVQLVVTDDWVDTHHIITKGQNTTKDKILKDVEDLVSQQYSSMMIEQTNERTTEEAEQTAAVNPMALALQTIKEEGSD